MLGLFTSAFLGFLAGFLCFCGEVWRLRAKIAFLQTFIRNRLDAGLAMRHQEQPESTGAN